MTEPTGEDNGIILSESDLASPDHSNSHVNTWVNETFNKIDESVCIVRSGSFVAKQWYRPQTFCYIDDESPLKMTSLRKSDLGRNSEFSICFARKFARTQAHY